MAYFSIRNKFFVSFSLLALLALSTSFWLIYSTAEKRIQDDIKRELHNSTELINTLVQTVARSSIENHLHSIAETQLSMVTAVYADYQQGRYSEQQAKELAAELLLRQDIGSTGYIYCLNSQGVVTVHRDKTVQGTDVSSYPFIRKQIQLKSGYLEYLWTNPGEPEAREKALYMTYFKAWDWIIAVSAYKDEFDHLIDLDNINKALAGIHFGAGGYPFIIAKDGTIIFHPKLQGNLYDAELDPEFIYAIKQIINQSRGSIYYQWRNPGESKARDKLAIITPIEDYQWFVGSTAYLDEIYQPLARIRNSFALLFGLYVLFNLVASYGLSTLITRPLQLLMAHFKTQQPTEVAAIAGPFGDDEVGALAGYLNQFIDKLNEHHLALSSEIAERKNSEQALRASEQIFYTLFDNSFQFILLLDPAGRILKINRTALSFHDFSPTEVLGKTVWEIDWWPGEPGLAGKLEALCRAAQNGQVSHLELHIQRPRELWLDISLKPVLDENGETIYLIAEGRNVSERRRAELDLQQAQKMESIGTLAGGIAHDFNNALAGILGSLTLLEMKRKKGEDLSEEVVFKHLEMISKASLRAKDVVDQLLTLSRKYDFEFVPLDLRTVLEQVVLIARNSFDKSIRIEALLDQSIPVFADAGSLEQVFLNLSINAAHSMTLMRPQEDRWGGVLSIGLTRSTVAGKPEVSDGDYWCITVSDSGVGIKPADLEQIFVPFFTTKAKGSGSGLGLAMVYNIVRQHKGFIEVSSQPGAGTEVAVFLPVHEGLIGVGETPAEELIAQGEGTILVVDDEELVRSTARDFLQECGYEVLLAENGAAGVALFQHRQQEIDLILLDLMMPVMSGKEAFAVIKQIDPAVNVLLSSGFRHDTRVEEILAGGAAAFIQKPYTLVDLSKAVARLLH